MYLEIIISVFKIGKNVNMYIHNAVFLYNYWR